MDGEHWRFKRALERLRGWGIESVYIILDWDFKYTDHTLYRLPNDAGGTYRTELWTALKLVQEGMKRAAQELVKFSGKSREDYDFSFLQLTANLVDEIFEYRGYTEIGEIAHLQRNERAWSINGRSFFCEIGYVSEELYGAQEDVFESWRPHAATSIKFSWDGESREVSISGNKHSIYYDALWPEMVPAEAQALRRALSRALPTPTKTDSRSTWRQELEIDFQDKQVRFIQYEWLWMENDFCSGIMPLGELVWLAVPKVHSSLSEEERADWLSTGMSHQAVTGEEVLAKAGIPEAQFKSEFFEDYHTNELEASNEPDEALGADCRDDQQLLIEELVDYQDAFARSEEEGWYYADD